jgi:sulfhydrogenase subunit delta
MSTKPKVAFFDFASCEGCQLQIANLEEKIIGLVDLVDVVEFREVMTEKAPGYDIAFIEGSITREKDEARLRDIRKRSGLLVALGACAATGGLNRLKNVRGSLEQVRRDVYGSDWDRPHLETYATRAVDEIVPVDFQVHGCPINREEFLHIVEAFALGTTPEIPDYPVCAECKIKENVCLFDMGQTCLGPVVRAGCGAICPSNGVGCEGCRGIIPHANQNAMKDVLAEHNLTVEQITEKFNLFPLYLEVTP